MNAQTVSSAVRYLESLRHHIEAALVTGEYTHHTAGRRAESVDAETQAAFEAYDAGTPLATCAQRIGVKPQTLYHRFRNRGWVGNK